MLDAGYNATSHYIPSLTASQLAERSRTKLGCSILIFPGAVGRDDGAEPAGDQGLVPEQALQGESPGLFTPGLGLQLTVDLVRNKVNILWF